jgi:hypothetical protein
LFAPFLWMALAVQALAQERLRGYQRQNQLAEAESRLAEGFVERIEVWLVGFDFVAALSVAEDLSSNFCGGRGLPVTESRSNWVLTDSFAR